MADPNFKFHCGDEVKHTLSGYKGVVVARIEWINGCKRYNLQAAGLKDKLPVDVVCLDEGELTLVKAQKHAGPTAAKPPGGPQRGEAKSLRQR